VSLLKAGVTIPTGLASTIIPTTIKSYYSLLTPLKFFDNIAIGKCIFEEIGKINRNIE
jgi:hypothetical protein